MPAHNPHPTSYPEVNRVLHELLSGVQTILGIYFDRPEVIRPSGGMKGGRPGQRKSD